MDSKNIKRKSSNYRLLPALLLAFLAGGCAGEKEARDVARVSLAQTIAYEQQVDQKTKAESAYYAQRVAHLKGEATALIGASDLELLTRAAEDFQSHAQSAPGSVSASLVRDETARFLDGLSSKQAYYATMMDGFNTQLLSSLESLSLQKAALERTRKALENLQREPGSMDELKRLFEFGQKTREDYDKAAKPKGQ